METERRFYNMKRALDASGTEFIDQRDAKAALRESEERHQTILDNSVPRRKPRNG